MATAGGREGFGPGAVLLACATTLVIATALAQLSVGPLPAERRTALAGMGPQAIEGPPAPPAQEGPPAPAPRPEEGPPAPVPAGGQGWTALPPGDVLPSRAASVQLVPPRGPEWPRVHVTREAVEPCAGCLEVTKVDASREVSMTVGGPGQPVVVTYNATIVAPVPPGPCAPTLAVRLCMLGDDGREGQCSSFQPIPGDMVEGQQLRFGVELPATMNVALDIRCEREGGATTQVSVLMLPRWGMGAPAG